MNNVLCNLEGIEATACALIRADHQQDESSTEALNSDSFKCALYKKNKFIYLSIYLSAGEHVRDVIGKCA